MSELVGTPAQVAEALETSEDSVLYLKQHRGLPFVMINRQQWRVPWKALEEWLAEETAGNLPDVPEPPVPDEAPAAANSGLTYTISEAAALLGISSWSYHEGLKRGALPGIRLTPRRIVVPRVALERLLNGDDPPPEAD